MGTTLAKAKAGLPGAGRPRNAVEGTHSSPTGWGGGGSGVARAAAAADDTMLTSRVQVLEQRIGGILSELTSRKEEIASLESRLKLQQEQSAVVVSRLLREFEQRITELEAKVVVAIRAASLASPASATTASGIVPAPASVAGGFITSPIHGIRETVQVPSASTPVPSGGSAFSEGQYGAVGPSRVNGICAPAPTASTPAPVATPPAVTPAPAPAPQYTPSTSAPQAPHLAVRSTMAVLKPSPATSSFGSSETLVVRSAASKVLGKTVSQQYVLQDYEGPASVHSGWVALPEREGRVTFQLPPGTMTLFLRSCIGSTVSESRQYTLVVTDDAAKRAPAAASPPPLTPTLCAMDPAIRIAPEGSVVFPEDVLVIMPGRDKRGVEGTMRGVSLAYAIEGYSGPATVNPGYQLAKLSSTGTKWTLSLPPGRMSVRVCAVAQGINSEISQPYKFEVKASVPTPTLGTKNPALFKPSGTTSLFRGDVLVITPGGREVHGTAMQYSIEDYIGPISGVKSDWQDARRDSVGRWIFSLPVGRMNVRVCAFGETGESAPSNAFSFLVKGA